MLHTSTAAEEVQDTVGTSTMPAAVRAVRRLPDRKEQFAAATSRTAGVPHASAEDSTIALSVTSAGVKCGVLRQQTRTVEINQHLNLLDDLQERTEALRGYL
jgi:hypothetical protein